MLGLLSELGMELAALADMSILPTILRIPILQKPAWKGVPESCKLPRASVAPPVRLCGRLPVGWNGEPPQLAVALAASGPVEILLSRVPGTGRRAVQAERMR
jgi:hypothetical protein